MESINIINAELNLKNTIKLLLEATLSKKIEDISIETFKKGNEPKSNSEVKFKFIY